jgi:hypothetical protein
MLKRYTIEMAGCSSRTNVESLLTGFRVGTSHTFDWGYEHGTIDILTDCPDFMNSLIVGHLASWGANIEEIPLTNPQS